MKIEGKDAYVAWIKKDDKKIFCLLTKDNVAVEIEEYDIPKIPFVYIEQPFEFERWGTGFDL